MFSQNLQFHLPQPWQNTVFSTKNVGHINFLVGPNGSGKSRFAATLKQNLPNSRMLGTDRLRGMDQKSALSDYFGDQFAGGLAKQHFDQFRSAGQQGSGIDTLVLLEERMDLRIQVEATLSHLFDRKIRLEWDSGNLQAFASVGSTGTAYRIDRDECHGIKELLVMLTHLYNDEHSYLIIDEPELNLHPQYQAFFLQEVRKVAGAPIPGTNKKIVFLITHSPFILDFRTIDDVKSVISFSETHELPKQLLDLDAAASTRLATLAPRLNVHHKQLFFSDSPIFVEGILDAQLIGTLQESRGVSVAGAGSCIIDAGGCEEVNRYLELCMHLGKEAHFVYDLDSLFSGNLRSCVRGDDGIQSFLAAAGVGSDFARYCGELDKTLTGSIDTILASEIDIGMGGLLAFLRGLGVRQNWQNSTHARARVATITALSRFRAEMIAVLGQGTISEIDGRLSKIVLVLRERNVHLLSGGTLERYLPAYTGNPYDMPDSQKRSAVETEIDFLSISRSGDELRRRYTGLFDIAALLPSKVKVDIDSVLRDYLSRYIHELQSALVANATWGQVELQAHLVNVQKNSSKVFKLVSLSKTASREFVAKVIVASLLGQAQKVVTITQHTNAGMHGFVFEELVEPSIADERQVA